MSTKGCSGLFLFCLDLELLTKQKDLFFTHSFFTLRLLISRKRVQNVSKKTLIFMVVRARQNFQFFRQITWFLGNNRALSKFRYRILYNLISITKL